MSFLLGFHEWKTSRRDGWEVWERVSSDIWSQRHEGWSGLWPTGPGQAVLSVVLPTLKQSEPLVGPAASGLGTPTLLARCEAPPPLQVRNPKTEREHQLKLNHLLLMDLCGKIFTLYLSANQRYVVFFYIQCVSHQYIYTMCASRSLDMNWLICQEVNGSLVAWHLSETTSTNQQTKSFQSVWTLMDELCEAKMGYIIKPIGRVSQHV